MLSSLSYLRFGTHARVIHNQILTRLEVIPLPKPYATRLCLRGYSRVVSYQTIAGSEALLSFFIIRKCFTKRGFARVTNDQTMPGSEAMLMPNADRMRLTKRCLAHDPCYQAMPGSVALPMLFAIRICLTKRCFAHALCYLTVSGSEALSLRYAIRIRPTKRLCSCPMLSDYSRFRGLALNMCHQSRSH